MHPLLRFKELSGLVELDDAAGLAPEDRYTTVFEQNMEALDHMFASAAVVRKPVAFEHIHVNTWATLKGQVSDHDPSVAKLDVCAGTGYLHGEPKERKEL